MCVCVCVYVCVSVCAGKFAIKFNFAKLTRKRLSSRDCHLA